MIRRRARKESLMAARNANMSVAGFACRTVAIWVLLFLPAFLDAAEPVKHESKEPDKENLTCELILGEHLAYLSLIDQQGNPVTYRSSGSSMFCHPADIWSMKSTSRTDRLLLSAVARQASSLR